MKQLAEARREPLTVIRINHRCALPLQQEGVDSGAASIVRKEVASIEGTHRSRGQL